MDGPRKSELRTYLIKNTKTFNIISQDVWRIGLFQVDMSKDMASFAFNDVPVAKRRMTNLGEFLAAYDEVRSVLRSYSRPMDGFMTSLQKAYDKRNAVSTLKGYVKIVDVYKDIEAELSTPYPMYTFILDMERFKWEYNSKPGCPRFIFNTGSQVETGKFGVVFRTSTSAEESYRKFVYLTQ